MGRLRERYDSFRRILAEMTPGQKASLALLAMVAALFLVAVIYFASRHPKAVLASKLDAHQIDLVAQTLTARGESFEVAGDEVLVPASRREELGRHLALYRIVPEDKLPESIIAAREFAGRRSSGPRPYGFDDLVYGFRPDTTPERQRQLERIAQQNELARMVTTLEDIASADVVLKAESRGPAGLAPESVKEDRPRGATVRVSTRGRRPLSQVTVDAIVDMIVSAVRNASPEQIVVVTTHPPRSYRRSEAGDIAAQSAAKFVLKRQIETKLAARVEDYFWRLGIQAVASVSVELQLDKVERRIQKIDPEDKGPFVTEEKRHRQGQRPAAVNAPRIGRPAGAAAPQAPQAHAPGYTGDRESKFRYETVTEQIVKAPGELAQVRAAVVLFDRLTEDGGQARYDGKIVQDKIKEFRRHVANAIGAQSAEAVEITYMSPAHATPPSPPPAPTWTAQLWATLRQFQRFLLLGGVTLAALLILLWLARTSGPPRRALPRAAAEAVLGERGLAGGAPVAPLEPPLEQFSGPAKIRELRRRIQRILEHDPRRVANLLRRWMARK